MKLVTITIACLLFAANASAATVTIDFEDVTRGTTDPVSSHAFNFSGSGPATIEGERFYLGYGDGGNLLRVDSIPLPNAAYSSVSFSQQGLTPFDMHSFWMQYQSQDYQINVNVYGQKADGTSIQQSFYKDFSFGNSVSLGAGWTNLNSVSISVTQPFYQPFAYEFRVDNIVVSTVPVPAAVWLFASGLGLIGWLRRRPTA